MKMLTKAHVKTHLSLQKDSFGVVVGVKKRKKTMMGY